MFPGKGKGPASGIPFFIWTDIQNMAGLSLPGEYYIWRKYFPCLHIHYQIGSNDIGKLKAIIAKERLSALNPDIDFEVYNLRITPENILRVIGNYDLVFDATDNFSTRYLINDACIPAHLINQCCLFIDSMSNIRIPSIC